MTHRIRFSYFLSAVVGLIGCGSGETPIERVPLQLTVTLNGAPVESGRLTLMPDSDTKSPSANAKVTNGTATISKDLGPTAGGFKTRLVVSEAGGESAQVFTGPANAGTRAAAMGGREDFGGGRGGGRGGASGGRGSSKTYTGTVTVPAASETGEPVDLTIDFKG